jgi:hypothetical protein
MDGHSAVRIAAPYQITKDESGHQRTKQVLQDNEAAASASNLTGYHDPLHRPSRDSTGEEERMISLQRISAIPLQYSRTY